MTTTFEVYPGQSGIPTFEQLLTRATVHLRERLKETSIHLEPELCFMVMDALNHDQCVSRHYPVQWDEGQYAWFFLGGLTGGIEVNFLTMEEDDRESWLEALDFTGQDKSREIFVEKCLSGSHYWSLRLGKEPAAVSLAHGLLAGSLAELTDGFIWSDDGAWDYQRFPATSDELMACYLRPEMAIQPKFRKWADQCWQSIPGQVETAVSRFCFAAKAPKEQPPTVPVQKAWWKRFL